MERIYVVFTSHISADIGHVTDEPIIAFGSKKQAEDYIKERRTEDERQKDYFSKIGTFNIKWWAEEISISDMVFNGKAEDRIESKWGCRYADNGWNDHYCHNCDWVINLPPTEQLNYDYCPHCGAHMVNPKGEKPEK